MWHHKQFKMDSDSLGGDRSCGRDLRKEDVSRVPSKERGRLSEYSWSAYTGEGKSQLSFDAFPEISKQRKCPHCNKVAVRAYYHEYKKFEGKAQLVEWCAACRRVSTKFIAAAEGFDISNPLSGTPLEAMIESKSLQSYLWKLNDKWERGVLPRDVRTVGR